MNATETKVDAVDSATGTSAPDCPGLPEGLRFSRALSGLGRRISLEAMRPVAACLGSRHREAFGVLCYHRVTPRARRVLDPTINVTLERFEEQMRGLLKRDFEPWPLRAVVERRRRGEPVPRKVFVVTFDDGYECVYRHAWPVLRELRIPATIFLATAYLDTRGPFPFDKEMAQNSTSAVPEAWRPLSTGQCAEMLAYGGIEIACHTHTHADFRGRPRELHHDLLVSLDVLRERFGVAEATFAFPYGRKRFGFAGPLLAATVRKAGLLCGLTTESDLVQRSSDPFDWGRFTVEASDSAASIATWLSGWYTAVRNSWRQLRPLAASEQHP